MSWMYTAMSQLAVSKMIGTIEVITGILLMLQPVSAKAGLVGGILAAITFVITLSFILQHQAPLAKLMGYGYLINFY